MGLGTARSTTRRPRGSRAALSEPPSNNLSWRVTVLEREVDRLKEGKPDVVAERVTRLSADVENLRRDMNTDMAEVREQLESSRKILIGFFVSFAVLAVGIAVTYVVTGAAPA